MMASFCMLIKLHSIFVIRRTSLTRVRSLSVWQRNFQIMLQQKVRPPQLHSKEFNRSWRFWRVRLGKDFITNFWKRTTTQMFKSFIPSRNRLVQKARFCTEQLFGQMQFKMRTRQTTLSWMTIWHGLPRQRTGIDSMQLLHLVWFMQAIVRMHFKYLIRTLLELAFPISRIPHIQLLVHTLPMVWLTKISIHKKLSTI